jgi:hypothetical protein
VKRTSITDAKNGLSALIDRVRHGESIIIEDRGVPVARIESVAAPGRREVAGRAARLERQGVLRPAQSPPRRRAQARYLRDPEVVVWWGTQVECASAIARLERDGALPSADANESFSRLDALAPSWMQIDPSDEVREVARRFLRVHPLRAADALQLAAAFVAAERRPSTLAFVTLDERLRAAASREGFLIDDTPASP